MYQAYEYRIIPGTRTTTLRIVLFDTGTYVIRGKVEAFSFHSVQKDGKILISSTVLAVLVVRCWIIYSVVQRRSKSVLLPISIKGQRLPV